MEYISCKFMIEYCCSEWKSLIMIYTHFANCDNIFFPIVMDNFSCNFMGNSVALNYVVITTDWLNWVLFFSQENFTYIEMSSAIGQVAETLLFLVTSRQCAICTKFTGLGSNCRCLLKQSHIYGE